MLLVKGKAVVYGELWFDEEAPASPGVDILDCCRRRAPVPGVRHRVFQSLVSDLGVAEDAIAEQFANTCRYQVRRADTKDSLSSEFITDPAGRLEEFCEYFNGFAMQKAIEPAGRDWLEQAAAGGQLVLSSASCNGTVLVWHAYLLSADISSLIHSASYFRDAGSDQRALVGRANRWLHWRDMVGFKRWGTARYDWGGMFEDESTAERAGINNFKRSFGGLPQRTYDYKLPVSPLGHLYLPLREAWRRWSGPAQPAAAAATA